MTNGIEPVLRTFLSKGSNWYKNCFGTKRLGTKVQKIKSQKKDRFVPRRIGSTFLANSIISYDTIGYNYGLKVHFDF